jgi:hypothetical protein
VQGCQTLRRLRATQSVLGAGRGGESVGEVLVREGLAEEWQGYRRDWC